MEELEAKSELQGKFEKIKEIYEKIWPKMAEIDEEIRLKAGHEILDLILNLLSGITVGVLMIRDSNLDNKETKEPLDFIQKTVDDVVEYFTKINRLMFQNEE